MYSTLFLSALLACSYAAPTSKSSPCEGRFEYEESNVPGQWSGVLNLPTEYKLYGAWIRLIFDTPVKSVEVQGKSSSLVQAKYDEGPKTEVLLKDKDFIIKKGEIVKIPFTVAYEGEKVPNLVGYRLNARDVCPGLE